MSSNISQFLDIFKNALFREDNLKEEVCSVVKEKTGFSIEKKDISCVNGILKIKTDPYLKTEILMKNSEILEAIRSKYPERNIKSIK